MKKKISKRSGYIGTNKYIMATWDEFNQSSNEDQEDANVSLMDTTTSRMQLDETTYDDDDDVFF